MAISDAIISETRHFLSTFFQFLKSTLNFEHFPKKERPHSLFISEIKDAEKGV